MEYQFTLYVTLTILLSDFYVVLVLAKILKMPVQNSNSKISSHSDTANQSYFKSLYQLDLKHYCVKKGNLHFVREYGLLGKDFVITPKKTNWKFFKGIFAYPKRSFFQETACPK